MKDLKIIVLAIFLSFSLMACELDQILGEDLTAEEKEDQLADGIVNIDNELFDVAGKDLGLTATQSQAGVQGSMTKLGAAIEQLADQLMQLEEVVPVGGDSGDDMMGGDTSSSDGSQSTVLKMLKGDLSGLHAGLSKLSSSKVMSKLAGREEEGGLGDMVGGVMNMLVATEGADKNSVVYAMGDDMIAEICAEEDEFGVATGNVDEACKTIIGSASIVQYLASETAGTLELHYAAGDADHMPLVIGYSESEWFIETHLADVKATILAVNAAAGEAMLDIPDTIAGSVRATIAQVNAETVSVVLGVTNDIHVEGKTGNKATDEIMIKLASSKLLEVTSVANTKKLTVSAEIGTFAAMFHEDDGDYDVNNTYVASFKKMEISGAGVTATVEIDFATKTAVGTDVGLNDGGVTVSEDGIQVLEVTTSISGVTVQAPSTTDDFEVKATADTAVAFLMDGTIFGDEGGEQGSIGVDAAAGTTIVIYDSVYDDMGNEVSAGYVKVTEGTLTLTGTGSAGTISISATADQCIGDGTDGGPAIVTCP